MVKPQELDLVETRELIRALEKRSRTSLFIFEPNISRKGEDPPVGIWYQGGAIPVMGLVVFAKEQILKNARNIKREAEDFPS